MVYYRHSPIRELSEKLRNDNKGTRFKYYGCEKYISYRMFAKQLDVERNTVSYLSLETAMKVINFEFKQIGMDYSMVDEVLTNVLWDLENDLKYQDQENDFNLEDSDKLNETFPLIEKIFRKSEQLLFMLPKDRSIIDFHEYCFVLKLQRRARYKTFTTLHKKRQAYYHSVNRFIAYVEKIRTLCSLEILPFSYYN